jgi:hypothetical protein
MTVTKSFSILIRRSLGFIFFAYLLMSIPLNAFGAAPLEIKIAHIEGEVLVKFNNWIPEVQRRGIHQLLDTYVVSTIPTIGVQRVAGLKGQSAAALLHAYSKLPEVEYVEPNGIMTLNLTPDDQHYSLLWGLENTGQEIRDASGTADADIDADEAWNITTGSADVVVAVIDSGIDIGHFDLKDNLWINQDEAPGNGIDDDGNGYIDDVYGWNFVYNNNDVIDERGHGTHVSGTIAARGNNGIGVAGVCWQSSIMTLKVFGAGGGATFEDLAEAVLYAANNGAQVSNNSYGCHGGSQCFSHTLEDAIQVANDQDMLFVVAAGNDNSNNDVVIQYPCNSEVANVLCVAATDFNDDRASFSNDGKVNVDLGAPGVNIASTFPGNYYVYASGTSMATPHVAGAAALTLSQDPTLSTAKLKRLLLGSVDPVTSLTNVTVTGGRLNVYRALTSEFSVNAEPDTVTVNKAGQSAEYTVTVESFHGFSAPVTLSVESSDPQLTATFAPDSLMPPGNGEATSTLTVSTPNTGPESIKVIGTNPATGDTRADYVTLVVNGPYFELASDSTKVGTTRSGAAATITVTITSVNRFNQPVNLDVSFDQPGLTGTFSTNPVTPPKNGTVSTTLSITADATAAIGSYLVRIDATDGGKTRVTQSTIVVAEVEGVDLEMTTLQGQLTATTRYGSVTLPFSVRNRGAEVAESTGVGIKTYFSLDTSLDVNEDILVRTTSLERTLQPLDELQAVIDAGFVPAGPLQDQTNYYIFTVVDTNNKYVEDDEQNNIIMADQPILILDHSSDLVVPDMEGPSDGIAGAEIFLSALLSNIGIGQAADIGGINIWFLLSSDTDVDPSSDIRTDGYAGTDNDLLPGASLILTNIVRVPPTVTAGDYYLAAWVDPVDNLIELDETNNGFLGSLITISNQADIGPSQGFGSQSPITVPTSAPRGTTITVRNRMENWGSAEASNFRVGFYIKPLEQFVGVSTDDLLLGTRTVVSLPVQGVDEAFTDILLPRSLKLGVYEIGFIVDDTDVVSEFDEYNNTSPEYLGRIEITGGH